MGQTHTDAEIGDSIVRRNLMTEAYYTPYCGADRCRYSWPRTDFNGSQFTCRCGYRTEFPDAFIARYKQHWGDKLPKPAPVLPSMRASTLFGYSGNFYGYLGRW